MHGGDRKGTSGEEEQHLEGTDDHNHQPTIENDDTRQGRLEGPAVQAQEEVKKKMHRRRSTRKKG